MERIDLEQGSKEWLEYRYDHRNASEAPTVMRCNPFQTLNQLRKIKETREDTFKGNIATDYGNRWEEDARQKAEFLLGVDLDPAVFRDGVYSASLDGYGIDGNESVKVEIKCPFKKQDSKLWAQLQAEGSWDQVIPENYVWQLVHQQMVCPTTRNYFFVFIPNEDFRLVECFITDEQIEQLKAGWEAFENPEQESSFDPDHAFALVTARALWKEEEAKAKTNLSEIEAELKRMAGEHDTEFPGGLSYKKRSRKGTVDTAKMAKDGIDVESYRKPDSSYFTFVAGDSK